MTDSSSPPRRVRLERAIYRRPTGVLEVCFKDESGRLRWRTVDGGILVARRLRDDLAARRARGESVAPNPKLRFGEATERWLTGPVLDLRDTTQAKYRSIVDWHLRPRFETRRLDAITADDLAGLVRELRAEGKSEATIAVAVAVIGRVYRFAARRLGWNGTVPTTLMLSSERPKVSLAKRRPIFVGEQLEQTIAAARQPFRTLFAVAALTGARISELCGLTWADVRIDDLDEAEIEFGWQVDRHGNRRPTKTDGSARTVPIPRELAVVLSRHKLAARQCAPADFVFAARTGRPLQQRNVARALRDAQERATDASGRPAFPILHEVNANGKPAQVPRGVVPSMHSFRHTVASRALLAGESVDEVAFLLGHRDGTVTRTVYVREVADARRRAMRRSRMSAEYAETLRVALEAERDSD
ncbi:MAG TPA: tyrosine-type recombinase/integrase [Solirubrobacteraceae bacterium]|nr:tyrosine-type recombinase/integrase [Solirubrobacteraceae bacterium]